MANDKPKTNLSFNDLDREIDAPEPFVYTTKASKRVTFPDIFAMDADEAEQLMSELETMPDGKFLKKWLSEEDLERLAEDKLTLRHRAMLMQRVMAYYEGSLGAQGEGSASGS